MVNGMEGFAERFADYPDCYTVIGGAACDILMSEADMEFRATKDIDMILIMESRSREFARVFWDYILDGGYRFGWRNSDKVHFYRFTEPKPGYPSMIELFSRKPEHIGTVPTGIVPIRIDDDTSSLSAILLNDDFYHFMMEGRKTVSGVSILDAEHLIPFKMYAWLDLSKRKANGKHVNGKDIKKHKNDVFRLLQITDPASRIHTTGLVRESVEEFMESIKEESIPFAQLGLPFGMSEATRLLNDLYEL